MNKSYLFQEIVVKNPVLIGTIGLCPIVAICTSLKAALIMSVVTILTLIVAQALSSLVLRHLPQWLRMSLYMLVGMLVVVPCIIVIEKVDPTTMLALGIYLPLLAVNPVIVRQCEREGVNIGLAESFINSLCAGFGYSAVLIIVGIVRELFGNGTIGGIHVLPITPAAGMLMPMGGFVVLSFMAALLRAYFKKIDPAYAEELAVNSRTAIKGHKDLKSLLIETDDEKPIFDYNAALEEEAKAEFAEESIPDMTVVEAVPTALPETVPDTDENEDLSTDANNKQAKSEGLFDRFGKKSEKPAKKAEKNKRKKASKKQAEAPKPENPPVVETQKPKYEFITLELPSAAKKAEEKAAAERAAAEKAEAERQAAEKAAEKAEAEKAALEQEAAEKARVEAENAAREKALEKKTEAKKRARKAMDEARKTASQIKEETVFAAPISEEEAKAETSTAKRTHDSKIVYRSEELERLMSMSLDDILNDLPSVNGNGEEGEK